MAALQLRGLAFVSGLVQPGVVAHQCTTGGRRSVCLDRHCRLAVSRLAGTAPVLPATMSGPPSKGDLFARTGSCRCMVSWLASAAGSRVWSAQQGACVWSTRRSGDRCSQAVAGVAGLDLLPGLSWTEGMLLYARHSGLMLGSVPDHVLCHFCGHAGQCVLFGYANISNALIEMPSCWVDCLPLSKLR